jgi:hypothetical protein
MTVTLELKFDGRPYKMYLVKIAQFRMPVSGLGLAIFAHQSFLAAQTKPWNCRDGLNTIKAI